MGLSAAFAICAIFPLIPGRASAQTSLGDFQFCGGKPCPGKNPRVAGVTMLQQSGARPRWSPDGRLIVFDRQNSDGYYDIYLMDPNGGSVKSLTDGNPGIAQRNNGNARFTPSGNYLVFVSEAMDHYGDEASWYGDPGVGLFSNLWATDLAGGNFWQLTDIPIKQNLLDGIPAAGTVNPAFSFDRSQLIWTERYGEGGKWGSWRIEQAPFSESSGNPQIGGATDLFAPPEGTYVTGMAFLDEANLTVAGNLSGQDVYGMDQYVLDTKSGEARDLTNTPDHWEEDDCISPNKQYVVFMSDMTSKYPLNFANADWPSQPRQREYFLMKTDGSSKEQLTFFNDSTAPEYIGDGQKRTIVAACEFSPDGRSLAATLGVDYGTPSTPNIQLKVARIDFSQPSLFANTPAAPAINNGGISSDAGFQPVISAGSWVAIFGSNLAPDQRLWNAFDFEGSPYAPRTATDLPTTLDGVSVTFNGKPAYISYISPTQINVLVPSGDVTGTAQVTVTTSGGSSQVVTGPMQTYAPGLFTVVPGGGKYLAAQHANYSPVGSPALFPGNSTPAKPGEAILLYGTGFGPSNPATAIGQIISAAVPLASDVKVTIGGVPAQVKFAGIIGAGLNQINVIVPNIGSGDQLVVAEVNGQRSQPNAYVTVQQ